MIRRARYPPWQGRRQGRPGGSARRGLPGPGGRRVGPRDGGAPGGAIAAGRGQAHLSRALLH
ncbi:hypothetical protein ACFWB3_31625, partial [[Kitasatospora] papulosa]